MNATQIRLANDLYRKWRRASREAGDTDMIAICDAAGLEHDRAAQLAVMKAEAEA